MRVALQEPQDPPRSSKEDTMISSLVRGGAVVFAVLTLGCAGKS